MKTVTVQYLKEHLSAVLTAVGAGARFIVTRHKQPIAEIVGSGRRDLHEGPRFGKVKLRPALRGQIGSRYLEVLAEDRAGSDRSD